MVLAANEFEVSDFYRIVIDNTAEKQATLFFRWIESRILEMLRHEMLRKRFDEIQC